jgi:hypothetical protein
LATNGSGEANIHQLRKKKINPKNRNTYILFHVIFSSFTPFVPKQDRARNTTAKSFVQRICENKPAVF